jgi:hypothetical protein
MKKGKMKKIKRKRSSKKSKGGIRKWWDKEGKKERKIKGGK